MSLTIDGQANSIASSVGGVNIPATVDTLSVGPSGSYMNVTSSGVAATTITATNITSTNITTTQSVNATTLKSTTIQHTNGTSALNIDSSGRVTKPYQPAFLAGNSSNFHTTNAGSVVDFNTEAGIGFDIGNNFDTTNYRFTAPVAGTYTFHCNLYQANGATTSSFCWRKNGTQLSAPGGDNLIFFKPAAITSDFTMCSNILLQLAANDYIDIVARNGTANVTWYGGHSWIMGYLIG